MPDAEKTIFISYRRENSSYVARAIFQDLAKHGYDVFMDVESINSGTFDTIILNQIAARTHFIVILSPGTEKRLAEPDDWLRREIEHAINLERNIVPVLVDSFSFKGAEPFLKKKLKQLSRYNGVTMHHDYFDAAMEKLRDRFLKKYGHPSVIPVPKADVEAVQRKINTAANLPIPTKAQLNAEVFFNRGNHESDQGDYHQAIEDYDKAIQINPQYVLAYYNRGNTYKKLGEHRRAIEDYDKAIQINPGYADAYNNRGVAYYQLGEHRRAIEDYDKAIQIDPQYVLAYNNRDLAYKALGKKGG